VADIKSEMKAGVGKKMESGERWKERSENISFAFLHALRTLRETIRSRKSEARSGIPTI